MKNKIAVLIIVGLFAVVVSGFGMSALADTERSYHMGSRGHHMGYDEEQGMGRGAHPMGNGHMYGNAYGSEMSKEDFEKFDQGRRTFFEATEGLRRNIYAKGLDLERELIKDEPDFQEALGIQKEISALESQLDQKRLEWVIKVKKLAPRYGRGFRGSGRHMMGGYHRGGENCWR